MHRPLEHLAELVPRAGADLLDARAALAEHDRALAVALDIDDLLDPHAAVLALFPFLGLDRGRIGQLLVKLQEELLARDLGREQAQRQVGGLVLGIEATGPPAWRAAQAASTSAMPSLLQRARP